MSVEPTEKPWQALNALTRLGNCRSWNCLLGYILIQTVPQSPRLFTSSQLSRLALDGLDICSMGESTVSVLVFWYLLTQSSDGVLGWAVVCLYASASRGALVIAEQRTQRGRLKAVVVVRNQKLKDTRASSEIKKSNAVWVVLEELTFSYLTLWEMERQGVVLWLVENSHEHYERSGSTSSWVRIMCCIQYRTYRFSTP